MRRRVAPDDRDGEPFLPAERVDLPTALDAFTSGSAYALRLEAETGLVTPGKLARPSDRDPFDEAAGSIGDARVVATLVEGEPVHADPSSTWADGAQERAAAAPRPRGPSGGTGPPRCGAGRGRPRGRGSRRTAPAARPPARPGTRCASGSGALGFGVVQVGLHLSVGHGADQVATGSPRFSDGRQVPGGGGRPVLVPRVRHLSA